VVIDQQPTPPIRRTALQVAQLAHAGSELVRVTVNNDEAAKAVPIIRDKLDRLGVGVPLIGDFHYNGHLLLTRYPAAAAALAKPHQPRQRRRQAARRALPADRRGGGRQWEAGAHRGQLGFAGPGPPDRDDGRQRGQR
jgi:hypothetical protein